MARTAATRRPPSGGRANARERESRPGQYVGNRGREIAQADLCGNDLPRVRFTREQNQERDVDFGVVEAAGMSAELVLAQVFPVVGRDNHQGAGKQAEPIEFVDEPAELLVEVGNAIIVSVEHRRISPG